MKYFIEPESTRLQLGDGEWIDVKDRLTHGEREEMMAVISPFSNPGERIQMQRKEIRTALVNTYLLGWSLTRGGKPVPMSPDLPYNVRVATIRSLSADAFDVIHAAINTHADTMRQADAKNTQGGEAESSATSPSPVSAAGDTNGSET